MSRAWSSAFAMWVAGVDVWRKRWLAVVLCDGRYERAVVEASLDKLLSELGEMTAIGIDMPLGLTSGTVRREADAEARKFVGPRGKRCLSDLSTRGVRIPEPRRRAGDVPQAHARVGIAAGIRSGGAHPGV